MRCSTASDFQRPRQCSRRRKRFSSASLSSISRPTYRSMNSAPLRCRKKAIHSVRWAGGCRSELPSYSRGGVTRPVEKSRNTMMHNPNDGSNAPCHPRLAERHAAAKWPLTIPQPPSIHEIPVLRITSQSAGAGIRTGLTADEIKQAFRDNLVCGMGRLEATRDEARSLCRARADGARPAFPAHASTSMENYGGADARRVAYLSAEFLLGPHLANNLLNLGITEAAREAMRGLGYDLDEILAQEEEPGLGNGGLGPARGVLHGFARVGRGARGRLRHPLRVRHFRSGHPRRLAVRDHRQMAAERQPVGDRALGDRLSR